MFDYVYYFILGGAIWEPGHGKYFFNGINTIDKNYISTLMFATRFTRIRGVTIRCWFTHQHKHEILSLQNNFTTFIYITKKGALYQARY